MTPDEVNRSESGLATLGPEFHQDLQLYVNVITKAVGRQSRLLEAAAEAIKSRSEAADEILRAVIVLTHAYLEDLLRTVATVFLPDADERMLDGVPLAGLSSRDRAEKFFLGKLARHRGKTIDDVIRESVAAYLGRISFNNVTEIISFLQGLGINLPESDQEWLPDQSLNWPESQTLVKRETLAKMDEMIQRRHQIVHRADQTRAGNGLQTVDPEKVIVWRSATMVFMMNVTKACLMKQHIKAK